MKALFSIWAASLWTVSALGIATNSWQGKTPKVFGILWGFSNTSCSADVVRKKFWVEARVSSASPSCLLCWCCLLSFLGQRCDRFCCEVILYLTTSLLPLSEQVHIMPCTFTMAHGPSPPPLPLRSQRLFIKEVQAQLWPGSSRILGSHWRDHRAISTAVCGTNRPSGDLYNSMLCLKHKI